MRIYNFLQQSFDKRQELFLNKQNNCFRLFNGSAEKIDGLSIDYYNRYLLIQAFSVNILSNKDLYLEEIVGFYQKNIPNLKGILFKDRTNISKEKNEIMGKDHPPIDFKKLRKSTLEYGNLPENDFYVLQNNCKIYADVVNGQSTGVFLDMREVRDKLSFFYQENQIKSLINLFSYTSVFSVHALRNNVKNTVNIDLSKSVLKRSKLNYRLNDLIIDDRDFIYGDSLNWIKRLYKQNRKFDFAIYDPPTFSKHKKKNFSVKNDYRLSLIELEKVVNKYVLTAINSFSISKEEYFLMHPKHWELVFFEHESSDFIYKNNPYLKVGLWKIYN